MWFDIICIIIVVVGLLVGCRKGFLSQIGAILGVLIGIVCCNIFADRLASFFIGPDSDPATTMLCHVAAYVIIFVVFYFVGIAVGKAFKHGSRALRVGTLDRIAGGVFLILKYVLVFSILLNAWISIFPHTSLRSHYSEVRSFVIDFAPTVLGSPTVSDIFESVNNLVGSA